MKKTVPATAVGQEPFWQRMLVARSYKVYHVVGEIVMGSISTGKIFIVAW